MRGVFGRRYQHGCEVPRDEKTPNNASIVEFKWRCPTCRQKWKIRQYAYGGGSCIRIGITRWIHG